ncbi:MAG: hypothetical protein JNK85_10080 [Verrucomicrobiales bacterium]|nr:hypothetical protein [Verrucomicrobiales bacterium]
MTLLLALLEWQDYAIIAFIIYVVGGLAARGDDQRYALRHLDRKLDALLKHHGIGGVSPLSPEVQSLAKDPKQKIAAIKLHRQQKPWLSLADAKADVEQFG